MHAQALTFVEDFARRGTFKHVIEFGSKNVNGSVRDVIACESFHGIDVLPGPGVDEVADAATWRTDKKAELVVCCEVLEHTPDMERIVLSAILALKPGGHFLVTCATEPRERHSAIDGGRLRPGEFYRNVDRRSLALALLEANFDAVYIERDAVRGDLRAIARTFV